MNSVLAAELRTSRTPSPSSLIDNSKETLADCLRDRLPNAEASIASGYLDLGALLALDGSWQSARSIRLLFGGEASLRSGRAFDRATQQMAEDLERSTRSAKKRDPFLLGLPAIIGALQVGKIAARVHRKSRFHAKATLTRGTSLLGTIGSSNLTIPGLSTNTELNVDLDPRQAAALAEWLDHYWEEASDVGDLLLRTLAPHVEPHTPFELYLKALSCLLDRARLEGDEWDRTRSTIYPKLAGYQRRGYRSVLQAAQRWNGALLCDGVGSGKTFVGLMLIERLVRQEGKRVALFVPKAAKTAVWEKELKEHLPGIDKGYEALKLFSHTDLGREAMREELAAVREQADVIIIDEAHHFRNRGTKGEGSKRRSRYWEMYDLAEGKTVVMLTATPINNSLIDFQHMVELFSRERTDHFAAAPLGIRSLRGHIRALDKRIEIDAEAEAGLVPELEQDPLFHALVTQRSRADIIASMREEDGEVRFPTMAPPKVADYNVTQTYGRLLSLVEAAFSKAVPLFTLAIYAPDEYAYRPDEIDDFVRGRRKQVVSLIRTSFLKRFESSAEAFRQSCEALLRKLLAWCQANAATDDQKEAVARWIRQHGRLVGVDAQGDLFGDDALADALLEEDVETLDPADYDIARILRDTGQDIVQLAEFLEELAKFEPRHDKKLTRLLKLLRNDPVMSSEKVIIFTEYAATARYLADELRSAGIAGVEEIDGATGNVADAVRRFAPYYNKTSSGELMSKGDAEIRVLIATDVLSEGLNLQDATRLVNYDLHWNPVRLMQRIGRIDRRMNGAVEDRIVTDHPERAATRGEVAYWNFLPPDDLDLLLRLYQRVAHKTLRISKTLGIEHGRLLRPDDDFEVIRTFEQAREGQRSTTEVLREVLQGHLKRDPSLEKRLQQLPAQMFSGRTRAEGSGRAVFFCYARPAYDPDRDEWTEKAGDVVWLLRDLETGETVEGLAAIHDRVVCEPDELRSLSMTRESLLDAKAAVEDHLKRTYLRRMQAPAGVECDLIAWMELN